MSGTTSKKGVYTFVCFEWIPDGKDLYIDVITDLVANKQ